MFQFLCGFTVGVYITQEYKNDIPYIKPIIFKLLKDINISKDDKDDKK
jgi:hypothetical protein